MSEIDLNICPTCLGTVNNLSEALEHTWAHVESKIQSLEKELQAKEENIAVLKSELDLYFKISDERKAKIISLESSLAEAERKIGVAINALNTIARGHCSCPYETHPLIGKHKLNCETSAAEIALVSIEGKKEVGE